MIPRSVQMLPTDNEEHVARPCLSWLAGFPSYIMIIVKNNWISLVNNASLG